MSKIERIKQNCINEIINIIKKYNISIDEIINSYIERYHNFNDSDKEKKISQYHNFIKYQTLNKRFNMSTSETSQSFFIPYTIIDDYIII